MRLSLFPSSWREGLASAPNGSSAMSAMAEPAPIPNLLRNSRRLLSNSFVFIYYLFLVSWSKVTKKQVKYKRKTCFSFHFRVEMASSRPCSMGSFNSSSVRSARAWRISSLISSSAKKSIFIFFKGGNSVWNTPITLIDY